MKNLTPGRSLPRSRPAFDSCAFTTSRHCSRQRLGALVIASLSSLITDPVAAADSCRRGTTAISTSVRISCLLQADEALLVTPTGRLASSRGAAVRVTGTAAGRITNAGMLSGPVGIAIDDSPGVGPIYNSGTLSARIDALRITDSRVNGTLRNAGSLQTAADAQAHAVIVLDRVVLNGGFANSGSLAGQSARNAVLINKSTLIGNIDNSGIITGGESGFSLLDSEVRGSLRNSGELQANQSTLLLARSHLTGDLFNSGLVSGYLGVQDTTIDGRWVNAGTIRGQLESSSMDVEHAVIRGGLYNLGSVYSSEGVDIGNSVLKRFQNDGLFHLDEGQLSFTHTVIQGDLLNRGTIAPAYYGFAGLGLYGGEVQGNLVNSGTLEGGYQGDALHVERQARIAGNLLNSGYIVGGIGVRFEQMSLGGDFINSGRIIGHFQTDYETGPGVLVSDSALGGSFRNSGSISGLQSGVALERTRLAGDLINNGRIVAPRRALAVTDSTLAGGLVNRGYIGVFDTGEPRDFDPESVGVSFNGSTLRGRALNTGTLQGNAIGVQLSDSVLADGLVNSGTLQGARYSLYVDSTSRLDNLYIAGTHARFQGTVVAPATTVTVYSDARYRMQAADSWNVKAFVNRGTLTLGARTQTDGGLIGINGDYLQTPGAVLQVEVRDAAHYGFAAVSGTATLPSQARIDVDVGQARQPISSTSLDRVLSASHLVSDGTFAVTSNSALFNFDARKVDDHVDLLLTRKAASSVASAAREAGLPASSLAAAQVLDRQLALGSASSLTPFFVGATSTEQVASRLTQALPMDNAALRAHQATLASMGHALQDRLQQVTGLSALGLDAHGAPASGLWSQPFSYRSGLGQSSVEGAAGTLLGFDVRHSAQRRSGWAFAYANGGTGNQQANGQQRSQLDLWQFLGYSSYTLAPQTELMVYGGAGRNRVDADRRLSIAGLGGSAKGEYDSVMATLGASLGHALQLDASTRLIPSLRLDFNHIREGAYREHGSSDLAPLMLKVAARATDQLIAGLDGKLEKSLGAATQLSLNLGVGYDLINRPASTQAAFAGAADQRFRVTAEASSPWLLRGGLGLSTRLQNGAQLSLNYTAQARSDFTDQVASIEASLPF